MIIYQIKVPKTTDPAEFAEFMLNEYFPAVHKGPTRVGQVTSLQLLQSKTDTGQASNEFFFQAGFSGLPSGEALIKDKNIEDKLKSFKARIKKLGFFTEVASWKK